MNNVRPQLTLLSEEQIQQVHGYALRILSETGVRVDSPSVIEMLERTKQVEVQGRSVKLSSGLVESAIHSAPSTIKIYDRLGNPAFDLEDDRLRFGVGVTAQGRSDFVHARTHAPHDSTWKRNAVVRCDFDARHRARRA